MYPLKTKSLMKNGVIVEFEDGSFGRIDKDCLVIENKSQQLNSFFQEEEYFNVCSILALYRVVRGNGLCLEKIWARDLIPVLSIQEAIILNALPKELLYIARDGSPNAPDLYAYYDEPIDINGNFTSKKRLHLESLTIFSHLFDSITYSNSPVSISALLEKHVRDLGTQEED